MADSSDIDAAVVQKLGSDPALLALCPNGVYFDEAPPGSTRFVIVSIVDSLDVAVFGGRAYEDVLYMVEARMLSTIPGANVKAAALRIDQLLDEQPLTVTGYVWMTTHREQRLRITEVDDQDNSIRWLRRGGRYRVQMSLPGDDVRLALEHGQERVDRHGN